MKIKQDSDLFIKFNIHLQHTHALHIHNNKM